MAEVLHLDEAVRMALEYRKRNPSTLIVVLGDHVTGGLDLRADSTGSLAAGPGAESFGGIHTGADIGRFLLDAVADD